LNLFRTGLHATFLIGAVSITNGRAEAQSASQITPPTLAPPIQPRQGEGFSRPENTGVATPAGADSLFVTLSAVEIEGSFPAMKSAIQTVTTQLVGKRVSGADIFAAARALEQAYAKAGYVLVRVVLPPQKLVDGGTVRLVVIDGYVERIDMTNVPEGNRDRLEAVTAPLLGKHGVTLTEIERRVLLAGDAPGIMMHSTLAPGSTTGATVLILDATQQAVIGVLSTDNSLASSLGRFQIDGGVDLNSIFGLGELVYLRAGGDPNFGANGLFAAQPRNRLLAGGFIVPIGVDGLTFNLEVTQAETNPVPGSGIASSDLFQRLSLRVRYPWLRSRDVNFASEIALDAQDERLDLLLSGSSVPLSEDRLRILRLATDIDYFAPWGGAFAARLASSFGLAGLGARTAADASPVLPLSRQGSDASFSKIEVSLGYSQVLMEHLAINLAARGQKSANQALARSEQIGIAFPTGLSAFDAGTLQGDSGIVGRGELSAPYDVPTIISGANLVISPYLFGAVGEVFLRHPTSVEHARLTAGSYGIGLRLGGGAADTLSNGSLALEFGRQARDDGAATGDRLTISLAIRY
jgi:hemolysin activation/secretion protein